MKKILSILAALGISATTPAAVMACSSKSTAKQEAIEEVKEEQAIEETIDPGSLINEEEVKEDKQDEPTNQNPASLTDQLAEINKSIGEVKEQRRQTWISINNIDAQINELNVQKGDLENAIKDLNNSISYDQKFILEQRKSKQDLEEQKNKISDQKETSVQSAIKQQKIIDEANESSVALTDELNAMETIKNPNIIKEKSAELANLENETRILTNENGYIGKQISDTTKEIDELKFKLDSEKENKELIEELNTEIRGNKKIIEKLQRDFTQKEEKIHANKVIADRLFNEVGQLKLQKPRIEQIKSLLMKNKADIEQATYNLNNINASIKRFKSNNEELDNAIKIKELLIKENVDKAKSSQDKIDNNNREISKIDNNIEILNNEKASLLTTDKLLQTKLDTLNNAAEKTENLIDALNKLDK